MNEATKRKDLLSIRGALMRISILNVMAIACVLGLLVPLSACTTDGRSKDAENEPGPYPSWVDLEAIDAARGFWEKAISTSDDESIQNMYELNSVSEARQCELKKPFILGKFNVKAYSDTIDSINYVMVQDGIGVGIYFQDQFVAEMKICHEFGEWKLISLAYGEGLREPSEDKYSQIYNTFNFFEDGYVLLGNGGYLLIIKDNRIINFFAYDRESGENMLREPKDFIDKKVKMYREIEANKGKIVLSSKNKTPEDDIYKGAEWKKWIDVNK